MIIGDMNTTEEVEPVDHESDPWKELEAADKQIRDQDTLIKSLSGGHLAKEVAEWQMRFIQLEGRLGQAVTTKNEAEKQARYYGGVLKQIRKTLGAETNQQIISRIEQLAGNLSTYVDISGGASKAGAGKPK